MANTRSKTMHISVQTMLIVFYLFCFSACANKNNVIHTDTETVKESKNENKNFNPEDLIAQIVADKNFFCDSCSFSITENKKVRLISYGEGADYKINPFLIESYDNDGIEIYFDMKNEKFPYFNLNGDDHQYRILWNLLQIDGQNAIIDGVEVGESEPSPNSYIMEFKFPWKSLGYITPKPGVAIGFDIAVLDNDGSTREGLYSWYSNNLDSWNNTSYFGTLVLQETAQIKNNSEDLYSLKISNAPLIDGKVDQVWENQKSYKFKNVIVGEISSESDLSGYFKTCWDKDNLYIIVNVTDDKKSYASVMFDYGWLTDSSGNVVWKMEMKNTKHAGGGTKNRYVDTLINLKPGNYILHYVTDESHSPANWDVEPPIDIFYGIKILSQ